jgi:hypothetical protein
MVASPPSIRAHGDFGSQFADLLPAFLLPDEHVVVGPGDEPIIGDE